VRFEVDGPEEIDAVECNCSICARTAYLHWIVARERLRLLRGEEALTDYRFGTGAAHHLFCSTCGVKSFYVPRSHPEGYSVNVRCLESGTFRVARRTRFDGANWEAHAHELEAIR
jgi:hypothetical protein